MGCVLQALSFLCPSFLQFFHYENIDFSESSLRLSCFVKFSVKSPSKKFAVFFLSQVVFSRLPAYMKTVHFRDPLRGTGQKTTKTGGMRKKKTGKKKETEMRRDLKKQLIPEQNIEEKQVI